MYSSLFTAGLQRAGQKQEGGVSFPSASGHESRRQVTRPTISAQQRLRVPSNPALVFSPSRRTQFATLSPRRKIKSSFSSSTASPLASIKTPIKAAEVAARMQSMLLSPSRPQPRSALPLTSMSDLPDMSGAPAKPKPTSRLRRLLPAKKPPPTAPLPSLPSSASNSMASSPSPFTSQPLPDVPMNQTTPRAATTPHLHPAHPPVQPAFSPSLLPSFVISPATPITAPHSNRVAMVVDDVFGPTPPRQFAASGHTLSDRRTSSLRNSARDLPPAFPESPIRPTASWR